MPRYARKVGQIPEIRRMWPPSILPPPRARRSILAVVLALVAAGTSGCGSDGSSTVVLRVGAVAIDRDTVDHWARAIALGSAVTGAVGRSSSTPRQKALDFLISVNWAISAATEHGLGVSKAAVARGLSERIAAFPHGRREFEEEISATGQTLADVRFEVKAALAVAALHKFVWSMAPVTHAQVADYYRHHLRRFRIPDKRLVDLIEGIHGYAHALALGRRLGSGRRFARRATRELVERESHREDVYGWKGPMVHAIFTTPPGRLGGPVIFHTGLVLLVVRKLVPGSLKPLREVEAEITERLSELHKRKALASFSVAYRREWVAKTSCEPGFVVQKCSGYRGKLAPERGLLD
jgi:hypothetical protein